MIKYKSNEENKYFDLRFDKDVEALRDAVYGNFYDMDYSIIEQDEEAYMNQFERIVDCINQQNEEELQELRIDEIIKFEKVPTQELINNVIR